MRLKKYEDWLLESSTSETVDLHVQVAKIPIHINIDWNDQIGEFTEEITLAMSSDSTGVYTIGADIEKFSGLKEEDIKRDVAAGKESEEDAIIYGLCNIMNGGSELYFWTNGTRLRGAANKVGIWAAVAEQLSHECLHLSRNLLTRAIARKQGIDTSNEDWITYDYGAGSYSWPAVGDPNDKTDKLIMIDEEAFATTVGLVVQQITPHFLKMAKLYIPQLNQQ
jgi:hypothetical protein